MAPTSAETPTDPRTYEQALVIGMGRSGKAAASLLLDLGVWVRGYDRRANVDDLPDGCEPWLGEHHPPDAAFAGIDLLVLSPGVDPRPHLARLEELAPEAKVHGELSLALEVAQHAWPRIPSVLITGTNGKSTVTSLTGHLLETGGLSPFVGGNLAIPLSEEIIAVRRGRRPRPGALVLECSSYQLETYDSFPTDVAMVLNVTPDHLDRYEDMAHYGATKARVFRGLGDKGLALLDAENQWSAQLQPDHGLVRMVGSDATGAPHIDGDGLATHLSVDGEGGRWARSELPLAGRHNAKNALFALAAARHLGLSPSVCLDGLRSFEGLPHRMRRVQTRDGVDYYDDSKATNVAAVLASLDGFERRFVLIAGGQAKGDDLSPLRKLLEDNGVALVAIGESRQQFLQLAKGVVPCIEAADMTEAVQHAAAWAKPGDAVVLSPACASWDMYSSYAQRGRAFVDAIEALPATPPPSP